MCSAGTGAICAWNWHDILAKVIFTDLTQNCIAIYLFIILASLLAKFVRVD